MTILHPTEDFQSESSHSRNRLSMFWLDKSRNKSTNRRWCDLAVRKSHCTMQCIVFVLHWWATKLRSHFIRWRNYKLKLTLYIVSIHWRIRNRMDFQWFVEQRKENRILILDHNCVCFFFVVIFYCRYVNCCWMLYSVFKIYNSTNFCVFSFFFCSFDSVEYFGCVILVWNFYFCLFCLPLFV